MEDFSKATVEQMVYHVANCQPCDWHTEEYESSSEALEAMQKHNEKHHTK